MAEKEQHHRHAQELVVLEAQKRSMKMGKISAVAVILITCITTIILAITGHHAIGLVIYLIIFTIIGGISYISSKKFRNKNETGKFVSSQKTHIPSIQKNIARNSTQAPAGHNIKLNNNRNRRRIK